MLFGDAPLMRSVAGDALVSQGLQVDGMLAALHGTLMAFRTGGAGGLFGVMDLMAVVAFKRLMRPRRPRRLGQRRFVLVAPDAFPVSGNQLAGTEVMAVGASQFFHLRNHIGCLGVTTNAYTLLRLRLVALEGMAGGALDVFLEPV
jgi:hypothetical protein